jgi:hypothetical protein
MLNYEFQAQGSKPFPEMKVAVERFASKKTMPGFGRSIE